MGLNYGPINSGFIKLIVVQSVFKNGHVDTMTKFRSHDFQVIFVKI